jgi:ankyrin repeat protein
MPDLGAADESLLSYALTTCMTSAARQLVEAGADVSGRDRGQWTLLGRAAGCEDANLVSAMLSRGADPNADEPDGGSVLWEPTNLGWRARPVDAAITRALERAGATRPTRPPVRK